MHIGLPLHEAKDLHQFPIALSLLLTCW